MEGMPSPCFTGPQAGAYAKKHDPFAYFASVANSPGQCVNVVPFDRLVGDLSGGLPSFAWITPDLCHDMHDCSIEIGDAFLKDFVPRITDSAAWQDGGVLFITWDEGFRSARNLVPTIVVSPRVSPGFTSATPHDHYSLLRTIQDGFGIPCLAESCKANALDEFFSPP